MTEIEKSTFQLETAQDTNWLKPNAILLESTDGSSDTTVRTSLDKLGVADLKEARQIPLPENHGDLSFQLLIRADYYVHFDNGHNEYCEDGYLKLSIKAGDSIRMIDFKNRNEICANIPKLSIRVFQCDVKRSSYSMQNILHEWMRTLYKDDDGKYSLWDFEPVEEMPFLKRDSREASMEVSVRLPPTDREVFLVFQRDKAVVSSNREQVPFPVEAEEAAKKQYIRPHSHVVPVEPNDTIEFRPIPNWEEEDMETALHEVLVSAPRPMTKDELWDQVAKNLEHGRPNERKIIFEKLEKSCQQNSGYTWLDTEMGIDLMKETHDLSMTKIFSKPYTAHIYFRALDHNPGGNRHYNTVRYSWEVSVDKSMNCTGFEYQTFDGTQSFHGPWTPTTTDEPVDTVRKLEKLIQEVASSSVSVNSLFNILDTTSNDSESELVEWTTVEIVVYTSYWWDELAHFYPAYFQQMVKDAKDANSTNNEPLNEDNLHMIIQHLAHVELPGVMMPVFRVQQRAVYGPQWNYNRMCEYSRSKYDRRVEANAEQTALIDFLHHAIGMKKATEWQWGKKDECRACAEQAGAHEVEVMYGGYQPCFFRQKNVTPSWGW